MNAFFNLKIILILTLTLSSIFSYAGLKDKFNEQQKPKTNSIPQEVLDIRDDINNTWDAIRKEGTFYYVMDANNGREIDNNYFVRDNGEILYSYHIKKVFPIVRLGNRVVLPILKSNSVTWKGKTLSCEPGLGYSITFSRPTTIGKIAKDGTASFEMKYLDSSYKIPESWFLDHGISANDYEVNFDTKECYTSSSSGDVKKCHIATFAEVSHPELGSTNVANEVEQIYRKLSFSPWKLETCKVQ